MFIIFIFNLNLCNNIDNMVVSSHINVFKYLIPKGYDTVSFSIEKLDNYIVLNRYFFNKRDLAKFLKNQNDNEFLNDSIVFKPIIFEKEYFKTIEKRIINKVKNAKLYFEENIYLTANNYERYLDNIYFDIKKEKFIHYDELDQIFSEIEELMDENHFKVTNTYYLYGKQDE